MRILLISDVHGNLNALESVLAAAGEVDEVWNLGDTIGYGPRPRECIQTMIGLNPSVNLAGNHDLACIGAIPLATFNPVAMAAATWTATQISDAERTYIEQLPSVVRRDDRIVVHGSPRDPVWEYVDSDYVAAAIFNTFNFAACFIGHTHLATVASLDESSTKSQLSLLQDKQELELDERRWLINPGSVGQPRDGDARAAYGIIDMSRGLFIQHRVQYDVWKTQAAMIDAGLPAPLADRLAYGR